MTVAQRTTAHRMIAARGQAVTLTREASGAYNPATGTATITETTQTGKGVILPLAGYRRVDGVHIIAGDETLLLSALASDGTALTAPLPGDVLTLADGTTKYTFTTVNPLRPAGLDIILDCVVRGHPASAVSPEPLTAIRDRAASAILDRSGDYILTRA